MGLFDVHIVVDWSAAKTPKTGKDSIWVAVVRAGRLVALENPPTRADATERIAARLARERAAGRRVLVGFDFPFGYPVGTAAALGLDGDRPWRAVWDHLAGLLHDAPDNANNRFDVGEALNRALSREAFPFWGHDGARERPYLLRRGRRPHGPGDLPERRLCDRRAAGAQPVWKLYTAGSVGSQALTGIPRLRQLRDDPRLAGGVRVWPFETGLRAAPDAPIVLAEVFPSLAPVAALDGKPKDAGQVVGTARQLARWDAAGALGARFAADPALGPEERAAVEREEAWILNLDPKAAATRPPESRGRLVPPYLTDPQAIYRRSFAIARTETDLSALPAELHDLALRLVHSAAQPELVRDLVWSDGAVAAARAALADGAPILTDVKMVARGITRDLLPAGNPVICRIDEPAAATRAAAAGTTRAAAAVELWDDQLDGAVVAIGNAPTALFRLLERVAAGAPRPAAVLGFPVGFVGAAESKQALVELAPQLGLEFVALAGRFGGSALAAAAVNALALAAAPPT